jgi:hypothetical protein
LVSSQSKKFINQLGEWRNDEWVWKFKWRRRLFTWEDDLLAQLMELIGHANLSPLQDSWACAIGGDGEYAVKDGYCFLCIKFLPNVECSEDVGPTIKKAWVSFAPMKVIIFSWQLILQRLPTRANLSRRSVIWTPSHIQIVWCCVEMESEVHLFTKYSVAVEVWVAIYSWLGFCTDTPGNLCQSFETFGFPFKCKKRAKGLDDSNFYGSFSIIISSKMTKTGSNTKENLQKQEKASRQSPVCKKTRKIPKSEETQHSIAARWLP